MKVRHAVLGASLAVACLFFGSPVRASILLGSQGIATLGAVTFVPGTDIASATSFSISGLSTTGSRTGDFLTLNAPIVGLGSLVVFTPSNLSTFSLSAATWGVLNQAVLVADTFSAATRTRSFSLTGKFTPAAWAMTKNDPNQFTNLVLSFTQVRVGSAVSFSGSLNINPLPPQDVTPEPATYMAALMGAGVLVGMVRRNRKVS